MNLIEEMTLLEFLNFHNNLKRWLPGLESLHICKKVNLGAAANKQIRNFSSGMKQRVKLAVAFFSDVPVVLLDEPTTNLDAEGINLYKLLVEEYSKNKLLIVSSNTPEEYDFCDYIIDMSS
jgi:ABC-type multidrug transport system ATPase subunit